MSHIQKFGAAAATSVLLLGTFGAGGAFADEQPTNVTPAATQQTQGTPRVVQGEENNAPTPNTPATQPQGGEGEVHVSTVAFRNGVGTSNPAANFLVEFNDTGQGILRVVNTSNAHSDDTWLAEMSAIPQGYELGSPSQGEIASGQALIDAKVATSEHVSPDGLYWYIGTLTPGQSAVLSVNKVKEAPAPAPAPESPAPSPEQTTPAPEPSQDTNTPAPEATAPSDAESPATPADAAPTGDVITPAGEHVTGDDTATPQAHEDNATEPTTQVSDGASTPSGDSTPREGEIVGVETVNATGSPTTSTQNGATVSQGSKNTSGKSGRTVKGQRLKTGHAGVASATTPDHVGVASGVGAAFLAGLGAVFGVRAARRRKATE